MIVDCLDAMNFSNCSPPPRDIPLVICAYLIWKVWKKTKIVSLMDIPLRDALEQASQHPDEPEEKQTGFLKFVSWIWD